MSQSPKKPPTIEQTDCRDALPCVSCRASLIDAETGSASLLPFLGGQRDCPYRRTACVSAVPLYKINRIPL
ncbi:MAG: hypothetical protein VSS75_020455 [Candidatus Parabeggiatoa sp.]|nr:hypothetical protein [Candidatus Parabeggiatoa sp.]